MSKVYKFLASLLLALGLAAPAVASNTVVTGTVTNPQTSTPLIGATLTFTLNQTAVVTGSAVITTTPAVCATDTAGAIKGIGTPLGQITGTPNYASGTIASGAYILAYSYYNVTGTTETAVGPTVGLSLSSTGKINIASPTLHPANATGYKVYLSTAAASALKLQATVSGWTSTTITSNNTSGAAAPTTNNTVCSLTANDSTVPQTTYALRGTTSTGAVVPGLSLQLYFTTGTVDVSTQWPLAGVQPRFPNPILANPASNATQSINSPLTLNGYSLTAGAAVFPDNNSPPTPQSGIGYIYNTDGTLNIIADNLNLSPFTFAKTCLASSQVGASGGAKIAACVTSLPSTGGIVDATGLQGAQTLSQNMFATANGPVLVKLGGATYSTTVTQTLNAGSMIVGASRESSVLNWTGSTSGTLISLSGNQTALSNLKLTTGVGMTSVGVEFVNDLQTVDNLYITGTSGTTGFGTALKVTNESTSVTISNVYVDSFVVAGLATNNTVDVYVSKATFVSNANGTTAIDVLVNTDTQGLYMTDVSTFYGKNGVKIQHTLTGDPPRFLSFQNVLTNTTSGGDGWLFDSTLTSGIVQARVVNCSSTLAGRDSTAAQITAGASGIRISGGQELNFTACNVRGADRDGIKIDDADVAYVTIANSSITENNQSSNADGQCVYITAAATNVQIIGNRCTNSPSGDMKYGVKVGSVAATGLMVSGNDFTTMTTGAINNGNTSTTIMGPNTPLGVLNSSFTQDQLLTKFRTSVFADTPVTVLATDSVLLCNAVGGAITYNLPAVATSPNKTYTMKKIDSAGGNACTLDGNASEVIDGATTLATSTQWGSYIIANNGTAWYVLGKN